MLRTGGDLPRRGLRALRRGAHRRPRYTFSATGRPVHNVVDATFELRDGLIVTHVDEFDFWRWSRQALGPIGVLLGWSSVVRRKVQATARRSLDDYLSSR